MRSTLEKRPVTPGCVPATIKTNPQIAPIDDTLATGSLWKACWLMSWPLLIATIANSLVGICDLYVAGFLGSSNQAAVGVSEHIGFFAMLLIMGVGMGTTAIVSRYWGEKNYEEAVRFTAQSLLFSFVFGILLSLALMSFGIMSLGFFSNSNETQILARQYLCIYSFYIIPFSIVSVLNAAFRAIGDAKSPLIVVSCFTTLTVLCDYLFVVVEWPVAGLGIQGIALAAIISSVSAVVVGVTLLRRSRLAPSFHHFLPIEPERLKRVVKIGVPSALQRLGWATSLFLLYFILSQCDSPTPALAALAVGMRLEALLFMPIMALNMAVASIVGQSLGAKKVKRAYQAGTQMAMVGFVALFVLASCMFCLSDSIASWISSDPQTIPHIASYLRIASFCEPFLAIAMILGGALQGAGDTKTPMWITIVCNWVVRLPLAYWLVLGLDMGPSGAWLAMTLSVILSGIITFFCFTNLGWTRQRV